MEVVSGIRPIRILHLQSGIILYYIQSTHNLKFYVHIGIILYDIMYFAIE